MTITQLRIAPKAVPDIAMGIRDLEGIRSTYESLAVDATICIDGMIKLGVEVDLMVDVGSWGFLDWIMDWGYHTEEEP